ncbi:MAG: HAD family hydrolase [Verrucomicrobiota bacterium]|nr:HAD family hydrolase [Verrucomicrobiota bacterium]
MKLKNLNVEAVIFDYGNTLIEFGPEQVTIQNDALLSTLSELFGACDEEKFTTIRRKQIIAPYATEKFIENDRFTISMELVKELYSVTPNDEQIQRMLDTKYQSFLNTITCPDFVIPLLKKLRKKYRLAFISNFPCVKSITDSLRKTGLIDIFESIVVSGDVGVVKPHPLIFRKSLKEINLKPEKCVYIGDNWLADIQGAKRMNMQAIHTTQYVSYENFESFDGDFLPDAEIAHLNQLEDLLLREI